MTETPQDSPKSDAQVNIEGLLRSLRRKEGTWVEWGQACQTLQKAGYSPQTIFEETGFEPIQQNQITVASQVYTSILNVGVPESVKQHFGSRGSDVLYEFRVLTQTERAAMAEFALEKSLDMDEAHEAAKAMKDFSRLSQKPEGFIDHPGDAIAYQSWKLARQQADLQERSRMIARGLRFAHSKTARKQIEQLLTDFSVAPVTPPPPAAGVSPGRYGRTAPAAACGWEISPDQSRSSGSPTGGRDSAVSNSEIFGHRCLGTYPWLAGHPGSRRSGRYPV
jgi:hypothetical protein